MKARIITFLLLSLILLFFFLFNHDSNVTKRDDDNSSPTEYFVSKFLLNKDGTIRTDFSHNERSTEALSESMGLWMIYLALKDDHTQFERAVKTVKQEFLSKEKLVMWEIVKGEKANTNALIDDLRIIETLYEMGERTQQSSYLSLANKMSQAILNYNRVNHNFVDFYDQTYDMKSGQLTLSYLNPTTFRYMVSHGQLSDSEFVEIRNFMNKLPDDGVFFPISYDIKKQDYLFEETVNLIDQLYISIYLERFGIKKNTLYKWIKESIEAEKTLYGRYRRENLEPAVNYESVAVYALAIIYSLEKNDSDLAMKLYGHMKKHQITDSTSPYFGGYTDSDTTHSFDNLLALIAERKLLNEHLIE